MTDVKSDFDLFHEAIRNGNVKDFEKYYKDEYLEQDQFRRKPIHYASRHGQVEIVKLLLSKKCDIEAKSSDNWRAIHYACRETHSEVAKLLIEHNCDIESVDGDNLRPIHHASRYGPYETAELLIKKKCNIEATEKDQWRPIHYACRNNQERIVQLLVDNNCNIEEVTKEKLSPIHYACRYGYLKIVEILIKKHANIEACTSDNWRPIHFASRYGYIDIFKELLEHNADIETCTSDGMRPIHFVCEHGYLEIFKILKNKGCSLESPTLKSWHPIHFACSGEISSVKSVNDHLLISQILIYESNDIEACTQENLRPIHLVCRNGHFNIANSLIDRGCNVEAQTSENLRPIHVACTNNKSDIVQLLIESGCNITALNNMNQSPLDIAKEKKYEEIINILNEKISNPDMKNGHRLLKACKEGNIETVKSMLKRKCDINIYDDEGMRPIHWACSTGNKEIVQLLIEHNCKLDVLDKSNRLPINVAEEHFNKQLIDILNMEESYRTLIGEMTSSMNLECNYQCDHKLCSSSLQSTKFEKGDLVGEGGFGKVYKCKSSTNNYEFAIKFIPTSTVKCPEIKDNINMNLINMKHIRIVQFFGAIFKSEHLCIFMEFVSGGALQNKIIRGESLPTDNVKRYTKQLLEGLEYLHENKVIHRDIKPANILLDNEDNVKLTDFDLSRILIRSDGRTTNAKTIFGTAYYMAPEVFHGEGYKFSSDIWSLGVTIYTMISGYPPYHDKSHEQAMFKIASTRKIEFPESWKLKELKSFMETNLLNSDPSERQSAKDLLKSDIFNLLSNE